MTYAWFLEWNWTWRSQECSAPKMLIRMSNMSFLLSREFSELATWGNTLGFLFLKGESRGRTNLHQSLTMWIPGWPLENLSFSIEQGGCDLLNQCYLHFLFMLCKLFGFRSPFVNTLTKGFEVAFGRKAVNIGDGVLYHGGMWTAPRLRVG